jgi:predicted nucleic acid-binding protein
VFILDTNVLSAIMVSDPPPRVAAWLAAQWVLDLFTAAVCQAEILAGLAIMPTGRRRDGLEAAARAMFIEDFDGRILPFDREAARIYTELFAARRSVGRPAATMELMIAAIARCHDASVVTRDTSGFDGCGLTLIDPWQAP